jgi:hypothetical protein
MNLASKFGQLTGDEFGGAVLLEAKLGKCMQVSPPGGHFAVKQIDEMWDLHCEPLQGWMHKFDRPTLGEGRKQAT